MGSVLSNYLGNAMLKTWFQERKAYVALFTADPTVLGSFADEVAGGDYVRQLWVCAAPSSRTTANSAVLTFDNLPATTVYYVGWCDRKYGGNLLAYTPRLATPFVVPDSARLVIPVADLALSL